MIRMTFMCTFTPGIIVCSVLTIQSFTKRRICGCDLIVIKVFAFLQAAMLQITGVRVTVMSQSGDNLCDSNACTSSPCKNGGICTADANVSSGFGCNCPPGYTGSTCEEDIDECLESMSLNKY